MKIGNKKFVLSKGLFFYSESEGMLFKEYAEEGWHLHHISRLGFYEFRKGDAESSEWMIDFYSGKKNEVDEYLSLYEAAGWELVTDYCSRYFVFKASSSVSSIYTDAETYKTRFRLESVYFLKHSFWLFLSSLVLILIGQLFPRVFAWVNQTIFVRMVLYFLVLVGLMAPIIYGSLLVYYKLIYSKREKYFKQPENYAKNQKFRRDMIASMVIGGIIGGLIGVLSEILQIF